MEQREEVTHQPQQSPVSWRGSSSSVCAHVDVHGCVRAKGGSGLLRRHGGPGWAAAQCQHQVGWEAGVGSSGGREAPVSVCVCYRLEPRGGDRGTPSSSEVSALLFPFLLRGLRGLFPWVSRSWEKPTIERTVCSLRARPLTPGIAEAQRRQSPSSGCTAL